MYLYNTLTRKIEKFQPLQDKRVGFYACGPTVYDSAHLGNLRTYIFEDILKRVLLFNGYQVKHVINLTDVDDKTIKRAQETNQSLTTLTQKYAKSFKADIRKLNILPPTLFAPATRYIKEMVALAQTLLKNRVAYEKDGSIYFKISQFKKYGQLSHLKLKELKAGARVDVDHYDKKNPADFVLWKAWTPKDGPVFWQTPLGKGRPRLSAGRPGWHLECSAISTKELGQPFDIHAGAVDLIFPHHENEIAQTEAATGKRLANFWLHGEHLLVEGQKMAKSLNNFFTPRDLEARGFNPLAFRYLVLTAHYRTKLNFTWDSLSAAQEGLEHLQEEALKLKKNKEICRDKEIKDKFTTLINNDLNVPGALALVWEAIKEKKISYKTLLEFDSVFGLDIQKKLGQKIKIPLVVKKLLDQREKARKLKDWQKSDAIREKIKKIGFEVEDVGGSQKLKVKSTFCA